MGERRICPSFHAMISSGQRPSLPRDIIEMLLLACVDADDPILPAAAPHPPLVGVRCDGSLRGWTALHIAARRGDPMLAKLLIASGANPDAISDSGATPLHIAAAVNSSVVACTLLDAGAQVGVMDCNGRTPLHAAAEHDGADNQMPEIAARYPAAGSGMVACEWRCGV